MNLPLLPAASAEQAALWGRLLALDLDGAAQLSFSRRLARDNGWPLAFAERTVLEYKKFVYLAATCGHPVTPSDEVDQAWHLHLCYTRSYWDELCGQVLGFSLHHGPTKGGAAEGHKFEDWYAQTRRSYQAAFRAAPPADIWPAAAVRFGDAPHFRRVNMRGKWLLPKPHWQHLLDRRLALALAGSLALVGCTSQLPANPLDWYGGDFLRLFWGLLLTLLPLALWLRRLGSGPREAYQGPQPSTYALARLAGPGPALADGALAALRYAGYLYFPSPGMVARTEQPPPTNAYECSIWRGLSAQGSPATEARELGLGAHNPVLDLLDAELEQAGLLLPPERRRYLNWLPLGVAVGLGVFGGLKVLVGLSRGRPVGLLVSSLIGLAIAAWQLHQRSSWATGRGQQLLDTTKQATKEHRFRGAATTADSVVLSVVFLGHSSLQSLGLHDAAAYLAPPPSNWTSSSGGDGGGSDSGGDGGGGDSGCGGCGGCGGD